MLTSFEFTVPSLLPYFTFSLPPSVLPSPSLPIYSLTHSLTHSPSPSLNPSFSFPPNLLTHSLTHSPSPSLNPSFSFPPNLLTHSLTHRLPPSGSSHNPFSSSLTYSAFTPWIGQYSRISDVIPKTEIFKGLSQKDRLWTKRPNEEFDEDRILQVLETKGVIHFTS